jgi:hypothetical protein
MKKVSTRLALCFAWLIAVGAGIAALSNYDQTPGHAGGTPQHWPARASIPLDGTRPTLVMFAHPQCPCTAASIGELNRLLARCEGRVTTHVFFLQSASLPEAWTKSGNWRDVAAIPNVSVHADLDGQQARHFGAETSGFVVLFSREGRLLFKGGITAGRGHAGDNAGANLIVSLVEGRPTELTQTPVYGCALGKMCAATNLTVDPWKE